MRLRLATTPLLAVLLLAAAPVQASAPAPRAHAAVTCADFPNQAAAQRAHNTRDADGDGIYCESLPCPCLTPGRAGSGAPSPGAKNPSTVPARCRRGRLPDRSCSPGRVATTNVARICTPGYTGRVRNVSEATKNRV